MLPSNLIIKTLNHKLIKSLRESVSAPSATGNKMKAIRRLIHLLQDAGFTSGVFDAHNLLDCGKDQVTFASRSLFENKVSLKGGYGTAYLKVVPIADIPRGYHTGSSQYASTKSELESDR